MAGLASFGVRTRRVKARDLPRVLEDLHGAVLLGPRLDVSGYATQAIVVDEICGVLMSSNRTLILHVDERIELVS